MSVLEDFSKDISKGFKTWEDREFVAHSDRDLALVKWVLRCLANTENPKTEQVLEALKNERHNRIWRPSMPQKPSL